MADFTLDGAAMVNIRTSYEIATSSFSVASLKGPAVKLSLVERAVALGHQVHYVAAKGEFYFILLRQNGLI